MSVLVHTSVRTGTTPDTEMVEVDLEVVLSPANGIPRSKLLVGVRELDQKWNVLGSGKIQLDPSTAADRERKWADKVAHHRQTPRIEVVFDALSVGEQYDRKELAALWGYQDWHAIGRGRVTPARHNPLILFITHQKQAALTQYADYFDSDILHIEGETNHANEQRILSAKASVDEIHLFYRDAPHSPFTYFGLIDLIEYKLKDHAPSLFAF